MLACSTIPKLDEINYPVLASPKLDGIRCLIIDGVPVSRNLKPIPNKYIQERLRALNLPNLDGELMLKGGDFNNVQSAVMSQEGKPDFYYMAFDKFDNLNATYHERFTDLVKWFQLNDTDGLVEHINNAVIHGPNSMEAFYDRCLEYNYEGVIVRDLKGPYKCGRSTMKQGWMLKLKTFHDMEAEIVGLEELMHNENDATIDALGAQVRSKESYGLVPGGVLGSLVVRMSDGTEFKIGTGFDAAMRSKLWNQGKELIGQLVTFKYQELSKYGVPRFPVFKSIRNKADM